VAKRSDATPAEKKSISFRRRRIGAGDCKEKWIVEMGGIDLMSE
jgi:hypothetical protein